MSNTSFTEQRLEHPDLLGIRQLTEEELSAQIASLRTRLAWFKERDSIFGGFSLERMKTNDDLARRIAVREERAAAYAASEAAARKNATAEVRRETIPNRNRDQQCVYASCSRTEHTVGPIWGWGEKSVKRALFTLSEECPCGAQWHREEETEH